MNRLLAAAAGGLWCLALAVPPASATFFLVTPPVSERVATAEVVITGKVVGFAPKTVMVTPIAGVDRKEEYKVAIVRVTENLVGSKGVKDIRVGFPARPAPRPMGLVVGNGGALPQVNLMRGQEVCLFLTKRKDADCYDASTPGGVIDKKDRSYLKDLIEARAAAKVLNNPRSSLKARLPQDRFRAAAVLIQHYRHRRGTKTEPIDAEVSKLIMRALAENPWDLRRPTPGVSQVFSANPHMVIGTLGATEKDGWRPPVDFRQVTPAARKWFKDHATSFHIEKFVAD